MIRQILNNDVILEVHPGGYIRVHTLVPRSVSEIASALVSFSEGLKTGGFFTEPLEEVLRETDTMGLINAIKHLRSNFPMGLKEAHTLILNRLGL